MPDHFLSNTAILFFLQRQLVHYVQKLTSHYYSKLRWTRSRALLIYSILLIYSVYPNTPDVSISLLWQCQLSDRKNIRPIKKPAPRTQRFAFGRPEQTYSNCRKSVWQTLTARYDGADPNLLPVCNSFHADGHELFKNQTNQNYFVLWQTSRF